MFSRSTALLGKESMALLQGKRVILFGIGGVGSWCAECLIRTGLKHLTIVDGGLGRCGTRIDYQRVFSFTHVTVMFYVTIFPSAKIGNKNESAGIIFK